MKKKHILLLFVVLLLALATPASATQYNPPWAHNYGFLYSSPPWAESLDTRSHATYAANVQSIVGYDSYNLPDSGAYVAFNNMKDDAVFYFIGHGGGDPDSPGGTLIFFNGTISYILAEYKGFYYPNADQYFLSSSSTELNDILLAVYVACYSGKDSEYVGNLVDISYQKGVDNTIGFTDTILYPHCGYWSDRFWYRCLYGSGGSPQTFNYAASGAVGDVLMEKYSFGGVNKMYSMYSYPYNYLNPVRYGIV